MAATAPVLRDALPSEDGQIAIMFYNSFIPVWNQNWFAGAQALPPPIALSEVPTLSRRASTRLLWYSALIALIRLSNGLVRVLAVPAPDGPDGLGEILACSLWTRPGRPLDTTSLWTLYQSGFLRLLWEWGWAGYDRIVNQFEGTIARLQMGVWETRRAEALGTGGGGGRVGSTKECAYLQLIAVREDWRGKGLAGRLVKDGIELFEGELVLLEATEEAPKRLYEHLGFEVVTQGKVGEGKCDKYGLMGTPKEGGPVFVMLRDGTKETYHVPSK